MHEKLVLTLPRSTTAKAVTAHATEATTTAAITPSTAAKAATVAASHAAAEATAHVLSACWRGPQKQLYVPVLCKWAYRFMSQFH